MERLVAPTLDSPPAGVPPISTTVSIRAAKSYRGIGDWNIFPSRQDLSLSKQKSPGENSHRGSFPRANRSLLFPHALEGLAVRLAVHEAARIGIAFRPVAGRRIEDLRTTSYRSFASAVTVWSIGRHVCVVVVVLGFRQHPCRPPGSARLSVRNPSPRGSPLSSDRAAMV